MWADNEVNYYVREWGTKLWYYICWALPLCETKLTLGMHNRYNIGCQPMLVLFISIYLYLSILNMYLCILILPYCLIFRFWTIYRHHIGYQLMLILFIFLCICIRLYWIFNCAYLFPLFLFLDFAQYIGIVLVINRC